MIGVYDHPWLSGLFADEELRAIWSPDAQMQHMLRFEAEWTRALTAVGLVDGGQGRKLAKAIEAFEPDLQDIATGTAQDGVPIPALVRQLKAALGTEGIHAGATSQDVVDTALVLSIEPTLDILLRRIGLLEAGLAKLEQSQGRTAMTGRTRMQAATQISVSERVATWRMPLLTHTERIEQLRPRLLRLQIGGASGDRAALANHTSGILAAMESAFGLPAGTKSWHAMRDGLAEFASVLTVLTGTLGKMGQDICLMAQQGIDEIKLASGGGSSAMPHKQNPIQAELLVTLARYNAIQVSGMQHAMIHEQERSGAAWALEWMILPQMVLATGRSLLAASQMISEVERIGQAS